MQLLAVTALLISLDSLVSGVAIEWAQQQLNGITDRCESKKFNQKCDQATIQAFRAAEYANALTDNFVQIQQDVAAPSVVVMIENASKERLANPVVSAAAKDTDFVRYPPGRINDNHIGIFVAQSLSRNRMHWNPARKPGTDFVVCYQVARQKNPLYLQIYVDYTDRTQIRHSVKFVPECKNIDDVRGSNIPTQKITNHHGIARQEENIAIAHRGMFVRSLLQERNHNGNKDDPMIHHFRLGVLITGEIPREGSEFRDREGLRRRTDQLGDRVDESTRIAYEQSATINDFMKAQQEMKVQIEEEEKNALEFEKAEKKAQKERIQGSQRGETATGSSSTQKSEAASPEAMQQLVTKLKALKSDLIYLTEYLKLLEPARATNIQNGMQNAWNNIFKPSAFKIVDQDQLNTLKSLTRKIQIDGFDDDDELIEETIDAAESIFGKLKDVHSQLKAAGVRGGKSSLMNHIRYELTEAEIPVSR